MNFLPLIFLILLILLCVYLINEFNLLNNIFNKKDDKWLWVGKGKDPFDKK